MLTFEISPPELYTLGLDSALEELAQRFGEERRLQCQVFGLDEENPLCDHVKSLLYRIVRELLINVAKHAEARCVDIRLSRVDGYLRITVEDNGKGFDVARLTRHQTDSIAGFGLFSIRERLHHVGGSLNIDSELGQGTKVTLEVPMMSLASHD